MLVRTKQAVSSSVTQSKVREQLSMLLLKRVRKQLACMVRSHQGWDRTTLISSRKERQTSWLQRIWLREVSTFHSSVMLSTSTFLNPLQTTCIVQAVLAEQEGLALFSVSVETRTTLSFRKWRRLMTILNLSRSREVPILSRTRKRLSKSARKPEWRSLWAALNRALRPNWINPSMLALRWQGLRKMKAAHSSNSHKSDQAKAWRSEKKMKEYLWWRVSHDHPKRPLKGHKNEVDQRIQDLKEGLKVKLFNLIEMTSDPKREAFRGTIHRRALGDDTLIND